MGLSLNLLDIHHEVFTVKIMEGVNGRKTGHELMDSYMRVHDTIPIFSMLETFNNKKLEKKKCTN